jgi:hypothetical protein
MHWGAHTVQEAAGAARANAFRDSPQLTPREFREIRQLVAGTLEYPAGEGVGCSVRGRMSDDKQGGSDRQARRGNEEILVEQRALDDLLSGIDLTGPRDLPGDASWAGSAAVGTLGGRHKEWVLAAVVSVCDIASIESATRT